MIVELCNCHPKKNFLGFRIIGNPYERTLEIPAFGHVCLRLADPLKGYHDHGWYLLLHGYALMWTPMRVKPE